MSAASKDGQARRGAPQGPQEDPQAPAYLQASDPFPEDRRPVTFTGEHLEAGRPHLVALDVDGTLVDHHGEMSPEVESAARAVVAAGHHVVIATGRSRGATLPICAQLGIESGYVVSSNGGVTLLFDPQAPDGVRQVDAVTFNPGGALRALRDALPQAKFAVESADGRFYATHRFQDRSFGMETEEMPLEQMAELEAVRTVVYSAHDEPREFAAAIEAAGLHGVAYAVGWTSWLDIAAHGVTKASALEQVRRSLGVDPAHTVAVGDGRNDIEMLEWAACSAAMGQAPDVVVAAADFVTDSIYDDGAARVLRALA